VFGLLLATTVAFCQTDATQALPEINHDPSLQLADRVGPEAPGSRDAQGNPKGSSNGTWTMKIDVWSTAASADANPKKEDPATLSRKFAGTALSAATKLKSTERRIANSIKMGFPLGEFWIETDFESIDDSLRLAALSSKNDADRQALHQLEIQSQHLRLWSDWLIEQRRELRLAEYYISASPLDNDERFQSAVACTNFLMSMLASGRLAENSSCM